MLFKKENAEKAFKMERINQAKQTKQTNGFMKFCEHNL